MSTRFHRQISVQLSESCLNDLCGRLSNDLLKLGAHDGCIGGAVGRQCQEVEPLACAAVASKRHDNIYEFVINAVFVRPHDAVQRSVAYSQGSAWGLALSNCTLIEKSYASIEAGWKDLAIRAV